MSTNPAPVERAITPWMATFCSCCRILSIHQRNLHDWTGKTLTHKCSMRCLCCRLMQVQGLEFPGIFIFLLTISQPIQTGSFLSPIIWYSASGHNKNNIYPFWMIRRHHVDEVCFDLRSCAWARTLHTPVWTRGDSILLEIIWRFSLRLFFPCCSWSETLSAILFDGWHPSQKNVRCKPLGKPDWSSFGFIQWVPWNK